MAIRAVGSVRFVGSVRSVGFVGFVLVALVAGLSTACASTLVAYELDAHGGKAHRSASGAIPYYLPRPYLVVAEHITPVGIESRKSPAAAAGLWYEIVYLPDLSRPQGLEMRPGLGSYEGEIVLENGWMFTGAHFRADPQIAESISALAELAAETGKLAAAAAAARPGPRDAAPRDVPRPALTLYDLTDGSCVASWPDGCGEVPPLGAGLAGDPILMSPER